MNQFTPQDADQMLADIRNIKASPDFSGDAYLAGHLLMKGYRKEIEAKKPEPQQSIITVYSEYQVVETFVVDGAPRIENGDSQGHGNDLHVYGGNQLVGIINSIAFSHITITEKEQGNG